MKKQFTIIVAIVFVLPLLAQTVNWSDYRYNFRWINGSEATFYSTTFSILVRPHVSLGTYVPNPLPTNTGCFFEFGAIEMAMYNSVNTWNNVNAYPQFSVGGYTDIPVAFVADGVNIVGFSMGNEIFPIGSNLLAIARPHLLENSYNCSNNPLRPFLPSSNGFDIIFNGKKLFDVLYSSCETNFDYPYYDFETVLTHELGHALGLDHHPSVSSIDVMNGAIPNATKRRNLSAKDEAALKALYPTQAPYPPCEIFVHETGNDAGTQNSGGGGNTGSGGSICHYIPPTTYSNVRLELEECYNAYITRVFEFLSCGIHHL